jgi:hypothetical protein
LPPSIVKAVLVSDIHLSEKPPTFRSVEPDWFKAMSRPLYELDKLAETHNAPIICAGDVFDRWNSSARLINFAIDNLPKMFSICGQHDLPNHSYKQIESSAYWTLCEAGIITNIENENPIETKNGLVIHGFHWNQKIEPVDSSDLCVHLAVIHKYIWQSKQTSYHDAPKQNHIKQVIKELKGFDAAVFGDNHKSFLVPSRNNSPTILNNGGFMRRAKDEIDYEPTVGLLFSDGSIKRHKLDCSKDLVRRYVDNNIQADTTTINIEEFVQGLQELGNDSLDFEKSIRLYCELNEIKPSVFKAVIDCIEAN